MLFNHRYHSLLIVMPVINYGSNLKPSRRNWRVSTLILSYTIKRLKPSKENQIQLEPKLISVISEMKLISNVLISKESLKKSTKTKLHLLLWVAKTQMRKLSLQLSSLGRKKDKLNKNNNTMKRMLNTKKNTPKDKKRLKNKIGTSRWNKSKELLISCGNKSLLPLSHAMLFRLITMHLILRKNKKDSKKMSLMQQERLLKNWRKKPIQLKKESVINGKHFTGERRMKNSKKSLIKQRQNGKKCKLQCKKAKQNMKDSLKKPLSLPKKMISKKT